MFDLLRTLSTSPYNFENYEYFVKYITKTLAHWTVREPKKVQGPNI